MRCYAIKISGIYCIENAINEKMYIGSSVDIKRRFQEHIRKLNKNEHHSQHLQRTWNKNPGSFIFKILEIVPDKDDLIEREQWWLDILETYKDDKGYNARKDADSNLGLKWSESRRIKNSQIWTLSFRKEQGQKSAKTYIGFISPEGQAITITNLYQFCVDNNLTYCHMLELINGKRRIHKGWIYQSGRKEMLWDIKSHSKTGIRGVYQVGNKYRVSYRRKSYGSYNTIEEATSVALEARAS